MERCAEWYRKHGPATQAEALRQKVQRLADLAGHAFPPGHEGHAETRADERAIIAALTRPTLEQPEMISAEIAAKAYFAKCSELGDAVITLDSLNDERKDQVLQCFEAAINAVMKGKD